MSNETMLLHGQPVTRDSMLRFKRAWLEALRKGYKQFTFDGQLVLVAYAKYVVEYAETQFGVLKDTPQKAVGSTPKETP